MIIGIFLVLYITYTHVYEGFLISMYRISEIIYSQSLAVLIADIMMYMITWLLSKRLPDTLPLLITFAVQLTLITFWTRCAHSWYFSTFPALRTAVIYAEHNGIERLIKKSSLNKKFEIVNTVHAKDAIKNEMQALDDVSAVFLCGIRSHDRNIFLKHCIANNITVYVLPRIGDVIMSGAVRMHMFHLPMLRVGRYNPQPEFLFIKRTFDITASCLALIILSPLMLSTAIAIKATDGGPVLYKQRRLTQNGRLFNVLKFRSMRVDAEQGGVAQLSTGDNDDRITPVGRFIRKCRIDELPQLINILRNDMSIVGPRPERPEIAASYQKTLPEFALRLQAKAGLTGYAQVFGKYNTAPYDKLQMDLMYIARPSLIEDLRIMFATVKILFMPESTEGVGAREHTVTAQELDTK